MTTAFVLSGGASLGAVQVGMLLALAERGERPDMVVGTSVGAINGAWLASRLDLVGVQGLADVWSSLKTRDVTVALNWLTPDPRLEHQLTG